MTKLRKQIIRFLVAGTTAVLTDSLIYYWLIHIFSFSISKAISFLVGTLFSFGINKFWTFEQKEKSIQHVWKFAVLYFSTFVLNVLINTVYLGYFPGQYVAAFIVATGVSTVVNFIGQKWWVFVNDKAIDRHSLLQRGEKHPFNS
ncbi:GtrA-like protein [compost metagenome]